MTPRERGRPSLQPDSVHNTSELIIVAVKLLAVIYNYNVEKKHSQAICHKNTDVWSL
jgi:hypothetical protein